MWWLWAYPSALRVPLFSLNSFYSAFWLQYSMHCIFINSFPVLRAIMFNNYWQSKSFFSTGWFHWCNATQGHGAKPQTPSKHIELTSNIYDQWAEETWSTAAQPKSTETDKSQRHTHNLPLVEHTAYRGWRNFLRALGHGLSKCAHWLSQLKIQWNAQTSFINHLPACACSFSPL